MDKTDEIKEMLTALSLIFPEQELTDDKKELYVQILSEENTDALRHACVFHMRNGYGFPKPVELL